MTRLILLHLRTVLLAFAVCLPVTLHEAPASAQRSGVASRRARARARRVREHRRTMRRRRAERIRQRRQRIRERTRARRQARLDRRRARRARRAGGVDVDFARETPSVALAEPETPPPTDLSYVDEMEQIVDERRRSQLDPELFGELAEGSTEQASGSSDEPREPGRTSPLTAEITVGGINRGLGYSGYDRGPLTA